MKEIDYVRATNLAKLRIVEHVLRDLTFVPGAAGADEHVEVMRTIARWRSEIELAVSAES